MVSFDLFHAMESSAKPIPYGTDESVINDIHLVPSKKIKPYRIQEAKISFECILEKIVSLSADANAGNQILGRVQLAHINDDLLLNGREIDWRKLDAVGRLSGSRYCNLRSVFESETN
jgi:flavin reductase (DIM6/NTAB) family NADH-FMN oxidoreductase RutF